MNYSLSRIDQFGVPLQLKTNSNDTSHKTSFGGIITIILYTLSAIYSIYIIMEWRTGAIPPKVSTSLISQEQAIVDIPSNTLFFEFSFLRQKVFKPQGNIITPIVFTIINSEVVDFKPIFSDTNKIAIDKFSLLQPQYDNGDQMDLFVSIVKCDSKYLTNDQTCAPKDELNQFFESFMSILELQMQIQQYNQNTKRIENILKKSYIVIESDVKLYTQVLIQTTKQLQDRNILFESVSETTYTSNFQFNSQVISNAYIKHYFDYEALSIFLFSLDGLQTEERIVHPKLGEILAVIGSIVTIILAPKLVAEQFNLKDLDDQLVSSIIALQYPKFKQIKIKRNLIGQIMGVMYNKQSLDVNKFKNKYKTIRKEAQSYLQLGKLIEKIIIIQRKLDIDNPKIKLEQNYVKVRNDIEDMNSQEDIVNIHSHDISDIFS